MTQLDVLLLIPTPPADAYLANPTLRQTYGPPTMRLLSAGYELEEFVGRDLGFDASLDPHRSISQRSLTSVALATNLERKGLRWAAVDPGFRTLGYWREQVERHQERRPRSIAVSTTYFVTAEWLNELIGICRRVCPQAAIVVGGYMYGTASREFLSLSADVICVGEGEERLPQLVDAIKTGRPAGDIPGLYLRDARGDLTFTGPFEPLDLARIPAPDWTLAKRIEPPIDPEHETVYIGLETQRGCVFKCQFCTFRTLTSPNALDVEDAVRMILDTARFKPGSHISLADPTATFPQKRWHQMMSLLAARGGSPHPLFAYARVNDLTRETVRLMALANVRSVFVGQESGDQRVITAMRKGTNVQHVRPCIEALAGSGIAATFGFIHGFPSETPQTMQATRDMICTLNDGFERRPVVFQYQLSPFAPQDLASVSADAALWMQQVPPRLAVEETLATFVASTRVRHAPLMLGIGPGYFDSPPPFLSAMSPLELFAWSKSLQRGVAIFLEQQLDGTVPRLDELTSIRSTLLQPMVKPKPRQSLGQRLLRRVKSGAYLRLAGEFEHEQTGAAGVLTRALLANSCYRASRNLTRTMSAFFQPRIAGETNAHLRELAEGLVSSAMAAPQQRLLTLKHNKRVEETARAVPGR